MHFQDAFSLFLIVNLERLKSSIVSQILIFECHLECNLVRKVV